MKKKIWSIVGLTVCLAAGLVAAQGPEMVTLSGKVIDISCGAKAKVMMDTWHNAENDTHKTPAGEAPGCATMCLKSGQPAGLFDGEKIVAVLGCNPKPTLSDFAAVDVDLQGFWAGSDADTARTFVPAKIREKGSSGWEDVDCATMHG